MVKNWFILLSGDSILMLAAKGGSLKVLVSTFFQNNIGLHLENDYCFFLDEVKSAWTWSQREKKRKSNTLSLCMLWRESPYFKILAEDRWLRWWH